MNEWIFTFGFDHTNPETGASLANTFCRISARTGAEARKEMVRRFGLKWAFQYASEEKAGVSRYGLREIHL